MTAFATVTDLASGWRTLDADEQAIAAELLDRAAIFLTIALAKKGVDIDDTDTTQAGVLKIVSCNVVRRAMSTPAIDGLDSMSQTIGSTTASLNWANTDGGFYLSKYDKIMLGIAGTFVGSLQARTYADDDDDE